MGSDWTVFLGGNELWNATEVVATLQMYKVPLNCSLLKKMPILCCVNVTTKENFPLDRIV